MTTNGADKDTSKAPYGARGFPESYFDVPAECFAGVVKDEGPDFKIEIEKVPVPEPGILIRSQVSLVHSKRPQQSLTLIVRQ